MFRILSLDGDGIKGAFTASVLATLEEDSGRTASMYLQRKVNFRLIGPVKKTNQRLVNLGRSEAVKKVKRLVAVSRFLNKFVAPVFEPIHPPRN